ncbi:hypothetical protein VaNZ11_005556 [Volvox africanus]|uniref:Sialate O-acetylesterase domain-containing protein n=1 Tax=Volvox africanus TaxID=51714 RepID=A0ABQ5RYV1_9CHLO|nr:hypothetical protein VaNZ11_005556 [Volvox africanus]
MLNFPRIWVTLLFFLLVALKPFIDPLVNAFVLGSDFIGIGAPWFPLEPSGAACYDYFFALAETNCTTHYSDALPVTLHNCVVDGASGVLILERAAEHNLSGGDEGGTAIYRLRVAGPDGLWLLDPIYCRPDFALAKYDLRHPGLFSIEVLMLYSSFSFIQPNTSRAVQAPWAGYLTLDVHLQTSSAPSSEISGPREPDGVHLASQRWTPFPDESILSNRGLAGGSAYRARHRYPDDKAYVPLCPDTGPLPGRWHFADWPPTAANTVVAAAALLRTCIWYTTHDIDAECSSPEHRPLHFDSHPAALSWKPYDCRMRIFSGIPLLQLSEQGDESPVPLSPAPVEPLMSPPITPGKCLPPGRRVCFIGDSHTRYLLNSMVLWQRDFHATVDNAAKELLASDNVHYAYMRWGDDWLSQDDAGGGAVESLAAANCTDVLANFGQWPASYRSGSSPYSALKYLRQLLRLRRVLLAARHARGVRVFWITTCMSSLKARLEAAGTDWRTDPLLTLYNRLALDVMSGELSAVLAQTRTAAHRDVGDVASEKQLDQLGKKQSEKAVREALQTGYSSRAPDDMGMGWEDRAGGSLGPQTGPGTEERKDTRGLMSAGQEGRLWKPLRLPRMSLRGTAEEGEAQEQSSGTAMVREGMAMQAQQQRDGFLPKQDRSNTATTTITTNISATTTSTSPLLLLLKWLEQRVSLKGRRRLLLLLEGEAEAEAEAATKAAGAATSSVVPQQEAIPVIDTWSATRILHDTTWDGVHYTNLGAVGLVQLTSVLHALCSETALAELNAGQGSGTG